MHVRAEREQHGIGARIPSDHLPDINRLSTAPTWQLCKNAHLHLGISLVTP
jgi:hypothetical protein